ncbi:MAG: hypothetical protein ACXAEX_07220 [Promethearchaeota archaeon]|jgi:hypothetical protein
MPEEAKDNEKKFKIIVYHGHLHKIPLDESIEGIPEHKVATANESTK